ncbi:hypothetical protein, partial [Luteolibacter marinus]|uniref:hypothetical protein n=1 Tax=Luteolibacter marinus TaxID=2776705 RepID=UPI00186856A3
MSSKNLTLAGALLLASSGAFIAGRLSAPDAAAAGATASADGNLPSKLGARDAAGDEAAAGSRRARASRDKSEAGANR